MNDKYRCIKKPKSNIQFKANFDVGDILCAIEEGHSELIIGNVYLRFQEQPELRFAAYCFSKIPPDYLEWEVTNEEVNEKESALCE